MKISTKGRYALRIMICLAREDREDFISLKDISERENISIKYLENIISNYTKRACSELAGRLRRISACKAAERIYGG
jgi:DNA replication protein DnaD